ncbi:hypothetical protein FIU85_21990 (plasmid) [Roseovarius sp. THAF8]|uniref:hypothetical protein n=1 Tax=Roseovarius sp. THAF8 TaxID=2587846 RepID=UPI001268A4DE|nr:hypothetical protein [Roseovarius sp. THAF8]QFU00009.1 hypothetical protein FIU85_21990 [Roseovarius sp. THAF8]
MNKIGSASNAAYKKNMEDSVAQMVFNLYKISNEFICEVIIDGTIKDRVRAVTEQEVFCFFRSYDKKDLWLTKSLYRNADMNILHWYGSIHADKAEEDFSVELCGQLPDLRISGNRIAEKYSKGENDRSWKAAVFKTPTEDFITTLQYSQSGKFEWDEYSMIWRETAEHAIKDAEMFVDLQLPIIHLLYPVDDMEATQESNLKILLAAFS